MMSFSRTFHFMLALCLILALLPGCEDIFGKESGVRGALPGKREDVFSSERSLKSDVDMASITVPAAEVRKDWLGAGGGTMRASGNISLSSSPQKVWTTSIGEGTGSKRALIAQPVVADGKIFAIDSTANVSAFAEADGSQLWIKQIPDPYPDAEIGGAGLAYAGGKLVATTDHGNVVTLDAASGKILWQKQLPSPVRSAPAVDGGRVYVITTGNVLYDLSLADGGIGWNRAGVEETAGLMGMAAPLPVGELLIVPFSSGQIMGLRKINGGTVWEQNLSRAAAAEGSLPSMSDIQGQLLVAGNRLYAASHSGSLVAVDALSGQRLWEADAGSTSMPWLAGDTLYVLTVENQLAALSTKDGRVKWVVDLPRYVDPADRTDPILWTGPVMAGGQLWLASSQGELHGLDPSSGKETASIDIGAPVLVPMVAANNTLYILSKNGELTALR